MNILLPVHVLDENMWYPNGAIVTITPEMARRYQKLVETAVTLTTQDGDFHKLVYFEDGVDYYNAQWDRHLDEYDLRLFEENYPLDVSFGAVTEETIEIECRMLNVSTRGVYWSGYLSGTGVMVETQELAEEWLSSIIDLEAE
jgi:hypothetical protein